jgi:hypothetical protein
MQRADRKLPCMKLARLALASLVIIVLASLSVSSAHAQTFGTVTLKPGETRQISIGPTFRDMRVCNDLKSTGSVVVRVGSSFERTLRVGQCAQDRGNMINFRNLSSGISTITYRALADPSSRWYQ